MFPYRQNLSLASYQSHYLHVNERHRSKRGSSQGSHCLISPIKDRRTFKGGRTRALNEAKDDEGRAGDVDEATRRGAQGNETQTKRDRKVPRAPAVDDSVEGRLKPFDVKQAGLKVAWFGAEALGNILADGTTRTDGRTSSQEKMGEGGAAGSVGLSRRDAMESLKRDYDEGYFVSGSGKLDAYARDCRFADPFTSFRGVDRFKRNVSNLGAMLSDVDLQILSWEESDDSLRTSWRFSGIVDLPWHPRLAAAGSTVHVFDPETGYVVEHLESWDTEPVKVLRTLLRPSSKIPRNQWEVFMNSVYDGDLLGMWLASSCLFGKFAGIFLSVSLVLRIITGEGLPGSWLLTGVLGIVGVTETLKFSRGMQGGETGTGGRF